METDANHGLFNVRTSSFRHPEHFKDLDGHSSPLVEESVQKIKKDGLKNM